MRKIIRLLIFTIPLIIGGNNVYAQTASEIISATGITSGLCVRVGTTDGTLEMNLSNGGNMLVYGIAMNESNIPSIRENINTGSLNGIVSVDYYANLTKLPFANNLVNLLVVDRDALGVNAPSVAEIERVVASFGAYYVKQGGNWTTKKIGLKANMGEWNHYYGDETNVNRVDDKTVDVPTSLQWIADVETSNGGYSQGGYRFDNGMMFYTTKFNNKSSNSTNEVYMICRNAANGTMIWRKKHPESDPFIDKQLPVVFYKGLIYTFLSKTGYMVAIDAKNGDVVKTFSSGGKSSKTDYPNFVIANDKIYLTAEKSLFIMSIDGTKLFSNTFTDFVGFPAVDKVNNRVYVVTAADSYKAGRDMIMDKVKTIACFNTNSPYAKVWEENITVKEGTAVISQLFIAEGKLYYSKARGISAIGSYYLWGARDLNDGHLIWQQELSSAGGISQKLDATVLNGKFYAMSGGFAEFDANNGNLVRTFDGGNLRCTQSSATSQKLLVGFQLFVDPFESKVTRRDITRSECGTLQFPSYGLIYYTGNRCQCANGIRGTNALSAEPLWTDIALNKRLTTKMTLTDTITPKVWPRANEWPMFMANANRTSANNSQIPTSTVPVLGWSKAAAMPVWSKTQSIYQDWLGSDKHIGPLTAPVVSDSVLVVSAHEENKIIAYNAINGNELWHYIVGGRLVSPPSLYNGLCIFGAGDGYVYCLKLKTGELVWKFMAAANEKKIVAHGHVETSWSLLGSLLIKDNKVIVNAGYTPDTDGGIYMWALNPYTGKVEWNNIINRPRRWYDYAEKKSDEYHYTASAVTSIYQTKLANCLLYADDNKFSFNNQRNFNVSDGQFNDSEEMSSKINSAERNPVKRNSLISFDGPGGAHNLIHATVKGFPSKINVARLAYIEDSLITSTDGTGDLTNEEKIKLNWESNYAVLKIANSLILAGNNLVVAVEDKKPNVFTSAGGKVYIFDSYRGTLLSTITLASAVVSNGLAAAYDKLYFSCEDGKVYCYGSGSNETPFARAGNDQVKSDVGLDGKEPFYVDGSASYAPYDSIVSYQWYKGATLLAAGVKQTLELTPGKHDIILKITSSKGLISSDTLTLTLNASYSPGTYRYLRLNFVETGTSWNSDTKVNELSFYSGGYNYPQCLKPKFSTTALSYDNWGEINRSPLGIIAFLKGGGTTYAMYDGSKSTSAWVRHNDIALDMSNAYRIYPDSILIDIKANGDNGVGGDSIYLYGSNDQVNTISKLEWTKLAAYPNKIGNYTVVTGEHWLVNKNAPNPSNVPNPLTAVVQNDSVIIQWTDANNNEAGYSLERKTASGYWEQLAVLPSNSNKFIDKNIASGVTYTYKVCAFAGTNISPYSNSETVTIGLFVAVPTNLVSPSNSPISIEWTDNATNEAGYYIERKTNSGNFNNIATVGANITQYVDNATMLDSVYTYRVCAYLGSVISSYSNSIIVNAPIKLPVAPTGLTAVATSGLLEIKLAWADNADNESGYDIYFKEVSGTDYVKTSSYPANYTSVTLTNSGKQRFNENITYNFYIVASNASGESPKSNVVTVKTDFVNNVKDVLIKGHYSIYPIPANKNITVELPELDEALEFKLIDVQGKVVYSLRSSSTFNINVSKYPAGQYILNSYSPSLKLSSSAVVVIY
ncbi:MAG: PQQ-binding-like beta-propeller repeat protein [Paludibacter sp.]|nr:PQQ-binding-like beta-propeller repeat protein [Paludibacter sp.]